MRVDGAPELDARDAVQMVSAVLARRPGYFPPGSPVRWSRPAGLPPERGTDTAFVEILARFLETLLRRLDQAPDKNKLAFLDAAGVELVAAQGARAPVVVRLATGAADARLPAGSRLVAPPPPESTASIVFEMESAMGLAAAKLGKVVSLWPGRDQFIDHTVEHQAGRPFRPFALSQLQDTEHAIYLSHSSLLALDGEARLEVEVELAHPASRALDVRWEYWDGEVGPFRAMHPTCAEVDEPPLDGTLGLTRSGSFRLETDCAETAVTRVAPTFFTLTAGSIAALAAAGLPDPVLEGLRRIEGREVATEERFLDAVVASAGEEALDRFRPLILKNVARGLEGRWVRGRLAETLPSNPANVLPEIESVRLSTIVSRPLRTARRPTEADVADLRRAVLSPPNVDVGIAGPRAWTRAGAPASAPTRPCRRLEAGRLKPFFRSGAAGSILPRRRAFETNAEVRLGIVAPTARDGLGRSRASSPTRRSRPRSPGSTGTAASGSLWPSSPPPPVRHAGRDRTVTVVPDIARRVSDDDLCPRA
jgi:hypothetical protein